jgi:hypothetical protein
MRLGRLGGLRSIRSIGLIAVRVSGTQWFWIISIRRLSEMKCMGTLIGDLDTLSWT